MDASVESSTPTDHGVDDTPITSIAPSIGPTQEKVRLPPGREGSEFSWVLSEHDGRKTWYRKLDGMASFILHWQELFHNHGDCYLFGSIWQQQEAGKNESRLLLDVTMPQLREALRRMRAVHPHIATKIMARRDIPAPPVEVPYALRDREMLQACITYRVPQSDQEIEEWLDEVIVLHPVEEDSLDHRAFFRRDTKVENEACDSFRVHFWQANAERGWPASIVLCQSHVLTDGVGQAMQYDELMTFLALTIADPTRSTIVWGDEIANLPAALQDVLVDQPEAWSMTKKEVREIERYNRSRINGKADPTLLDKIADRVLEKTLARAASRSKIRRAVNEPLVRAARVVAQSGATFPLGVLPVATKPYNGPYTFSDFFDERLSREDTRMLLKGVKERDLTVAPFVEAAMILATTWVRRHRGLTPSADRWDNPSRILGSLSNAISRRGTLTPESQRYLGCAMGGFVTRIAAPDAEWSEQSLRTTVPSPDLADDKIPGKIEDADLSTVEAIAKQLARQYKEGREDSDWLKSSEATTLGTMRAEKALLTNEAYYPCQPWLSSVGMADSLLTPSRPIPHSHSSSPFSAVDFDPSQPSSEKLGSGTTALIVTDIRFIGRQNLAQPILHSFSYRGEMTFQVSFPDWLYNTSDNGRRAKRKEWQELAARGSILPFWFRVFRMIVQKVIDEARESSA